MIGNTILRCCRLWFLKSLSLQIEAGGSYISGRNSSLPPGAKVMIDDVTAPLCIGRISVGQSWAKIIIFYHRYITVPADIDQPWTNDPLYSVGPLRCHVWSWGLTWGPHCVWQRLRKYRGTVLHDGGRGRLRQTWINIWPSIRNICRSRFAGLGAGHA